MWKLAWKYMRYYRNQTFAISISLLLTAGLFSGIGSLLYSSRQNELKNMKNIYGEWHYALTADSILYDTLKNNVNIQNDSFQTQDSSADDSLQAQGSSADYFLQNCGRMQYRDSLSEPFPITFLYTDEVCRRLTHREILEGKYPEKENEIAADRYTLSNLNFSGQIGGSLVIGTQTYTVTGIIKNMWAANADDMQIFVNENFSCTDMNCTDINCADMDRLYLQFSEDKKLYLQLNAFLQKYQLSGEAVEDNNPVTSYLHGERPESIFEIVKFALTDERGNFTYIVLKLQEAYNLSFYTMLSLLFVFSFLVIYSIFNVSVAKRTSQYGILQTLGVEEKHIFGSMLIELWTLFLLCYPLGCLLGNSFLKLFYHRFNRIFTGGSTTASDTPVTLTGAEQIQNTAIESEFHIAWTAAIIGFFLLMAALTVIAYMTVRSMRKYTLRQVMDENRSTVQGTRKIRPHKLKNVHWTFLSYAWQNNRPLHNKIHSRRHSNLTGILMRKFMFSKRLKFIGLLLSLSLGGSLFLCTTYMVENLKIHAQMSMKSDDELGSEYRISEKSDSLADTIPESTAEKIKKIPGLKDIYATKYTLGEITITKEEFEYENGIWAEYFNEMNRTEILQELYGGICIPKDNNTYGIKYDVYGYDSAMLEQLDDFLLEGEIRLDELTDGNKVIITANVDGQGNYYLYGKHPGDRIRLKVPKSQSCSPEILKFESSDNSYIEKEYEIAAIVSRPLAKEEYFLNRDIWKSSQSVIFSNQQMEQNFGIRSYSIINASAAENADRNTVSAALLSEISEVPRAVLTDYSSAIESQQNYLRQQQLFFTGISVILLLISLFHIMNRMNYSILARRREFGILRAMGITDSGFYRMLLKEGLIYGICADIFLFLLFHLVLRRWMDYYMQHVVQFLHFSSGISQTVLFMIFALNLVIAVIAVYLPARKIVRNHIVDELRQ